MSNNNKFFKKWLFIKRKLVILVEEEKGEYLGKKVNYTMSRKILQGS